MSLKVQALALITIHEEPFPLPYFCDKGNFSSVTSVVQTNYLSHSSVTSKSASNLKNTMADQQKPYLLNTHHIKIT